MNKLCIVEDDLSYGNLLKNYLTKKGFQVELFTNGLKALEKITAEGVDLVLCDIRLPDIEGVELMKRVKDIKPEIDFVFMTGFANVSSAVHAMKAGGVDYLAKPFHPEQLLSLIESYFQTKKNTKPSSKNDYILGKSDLSKNILNQIELVAPTEFSVIITGESGTGKELIAKLLHQKSNRADKPFIAVDCGTVPDDLGSSAFFGHTKGAFTGAIFDQKGYFEMANGGTLFLDEIGNLSYENQIKLLRALQERKIQPLGSQKSIEVDVRIIAATNENIASKVQSNFFREDLFHRLNEFSINSPALRDRGNEIVDLAHFFVKKYSAVLNKNIDGFDINCTQLLLQYPWPGNVRELENVIKRAVLLCNTTEITKENLPSELWNDKTATSPSGIQKNQVEKVMIERALQIAQGNKSQAAQLLNISRKTLYNKMEQLGITT